MESSFLKNSDNVSATGSYISPNNCANYKEIISNLPQKSNWYPSQNLHDYQGFWIHPNFLEGIMSAQENFIAQPTDIVICSIPKSGMTWLKALCFAIMGRTQLSDPTKNRLLSELPHDIVPFIEALSQNDHIRDPDHLPLWATHAPFNLLPKNPKDVFVSLWHFVASLGSTETVPLEEAFQKFCEGVSAYGPYWNHVLGYWNASLQFPDRILVIKYEDLQSDAFSLVKRLAEFMGFPFSVEEERQELVQQVVDLCSFQSLSNLEVNKSKKYFSSLPVKFEHNAFFRKGKIGDWENYLTAEMAAQLDEITAKMFSGSRLSFAS